MATLFACVGSAGRNEAAYASPHREYNGDNTPVQRSDHLASDFTILATRRVDLDSIFVGEDGERASALGAKLITANTAEFRRVRGLDVEDWTTAT